VTVTARGCAASWRLSRDCVDMRCPEHSAAARLVRRGVAEAELTRAPRARRHLRLRPQCSTGLGALWRSLLGARRALLRCRY
jgi:hypothetical protein